MKIFHYRSSFLKLRTQIQGSIGFVPTMGALHEGHLDLVKQAKSTTNQCVVSIFINPRQFNNPDDLKKYPKTIEADLKLLHHAGADFVFIPETQDFYANTAAVELDIHPLDSVFEGKFRPGHFKGVVDVLHRFFSIVRPTDVFMGLKDLQQCLVVEKLIHEYYADMKQHNCETRREPSGLAMSSRNVRLSDQGRLKANGIYAELQYLREHKMQFDTFVNTSLRNLRTLGFETEYLSMVSLPNLKKVTDPESEKAAIIFAGHLEGVRLIDNLLV